jgi:hypothetical protein
MYPTIAIALAGAVPQYYQWVAAATMGLPLGGNVADAQEQAKAWGRNVGCLHDIDHIKPSARTNYSIEMLACPSGDILLTLTPLQNPDQPVNRWIVTRSLFTQVADSSSPNMTLAQGPTTRSAAAAAATSVRVVDVKTQGKIITRRIQLSDNTCIDETIDAYTGRRLSQTQAPCTKFDAR